MSKRHRRERGVRSGAPHRVPNPSGYTGPKIVKEEDPSVDLNTPLGDGTPPNGGASKKIAAAIMSLAFIFAVTVATTAIVKFVVMVALWVWGVLPSIDAVWGNDV